MIFLRPSGESVDLHRAPFAEWQAAETEILERFSNGRKRLAALQLRLVHNWPAHQIAGILGLSRGHVNRLIRETRRGLAEKLPEPRKRRAGVE